MLGKQIDELSLTGSLPSPTGVGLAILRHTQNDDFTMGELIRATKSDPALTGMLLKLANTGKRGSARPSRTVSSAAMQLGVRSVRDVALGFSLISGNRTVRCARFDYEEYWSHSLAMAVSAEILGRIFGEVDPDEAFTCAILSGIGKLALASIHPETFSGLLDESQGMGVEDLIALERRALDVDHRELSGAMMKDWKLPEAFAFAITNFELADEGAPSDQARKMTATLRAANRLAKACVPPARMPPSDWKQRWSDLEQLGRDLGMDSEKFNGLCKVLAEKWRTRSQVLEVPCEPTPSLEELARRVRNEEPRRPRRPVRRDHIRLGLSVLAVDDDPVSLRLLTHHLTRDGHTVTTAKDGRQALALALQYHPQMVVTDWMMPEMDGIELCKALRSSSENNATYILLVTGREDEDRVIEAFGAGADEYLTKPFNPRILLARVRAGQRMIELREQSESDKQARVQQVAHMAVLNRKLRTAAMTDVLTALPNRRYAMKRLHEELKESADSGAPMSAIMIDIDHFKQVNDQHGHDVGDVVLSETAEVLRRSTRRGEVVCRLGGEEFLVICIATSTDDCAKTAERLRHAIEKRILHVGTFRSSVTASFGVSSLCDSVLTVDDLLMAADKYLYEAKAGGRNRVCVDPQALAYSRRSKSA
jgi:diguanylate cyclase (GGDEF)-like protein